MKKALILGTLLVLGGCKATMNPVHEAWIKGDRYGTPDGFPCIRCGEDFRFIPNEPMAAIRQSKRIYDFEWGDPNKAPVY